MTSAIQIKGLSYFYASGAAALEDINLTIADNELVALVGQNGAGKSTLLKNITGLLRPQGGDIFIRGKNARGLSVSAISREIGFVMQNPDRQLFADTVRAEIAFGLKNAKLPADEIRQRTEAALETAGLAGKGDEFPQALSRGDRAKTVIASVLAMGSKIIILDEPAAAQDYQNSRRIMDTIGNLHERGYTVMFVTHNMSLAARARRVVVMHEKRIMLDGDSRAVFSRGDELAKAGILMPPAARFCRELRKTIPLERDALSVEELGESLLDLKRRGV